MQNKDARKNGRGLCQSLPWKPASTKTDRSKTTRSPRLTKLKDKWTPKAQIYPSVITKLKTSTGSHAKILQSRRESNRSNSTWTHGTSNIPAGCTAFSFSRSKSWTLKSSTTTESSGASRPKQPRYPEPQPASTSS